MLELLRTLEEDDRFATPAEQTRLAQYSSWGGCREIFDRTLSSWTAERDRLHGLVDDRTYSQLREAGLTAFYTAPDVTQAMWGALKEAGLNAGTVLEPGSGVGGFIASAPTTVRMVGVEVDPVAATISRHLYPAETIRNEGFEKTSVADGSFNAVIGNVPFADMRLNDPAHNSGQHSIHNHFIIKSLNLTQPGGYVALLTSSFTADAQRSDARKEMIDRADLISAVRLPSQAFKAVAGTEVISDLLVFRVREPERQSTQKSVDFLKTDVLEVGDKELRVNATLARSTGNILGTATVSTGRFGDPVLNVSGSASDLGERLAQVVSGDIAIAKSQGLGHTASSSVAAEEFTRSSSLETVLPGTYRYAFDEAGVPQFEQYDAGSRQWQTVAFRGFNDARKQEWKQLLELRDAVVDLRDAYTSGTADQTSQSQRVLSDRYDTYVEEYGLINRFEAPKPSPPTKKQQDETFRDLANEWRLAHGEPATADLPDEVEADFREQASAPRIVDPTPRPHLNRISRDPLFAQVRALESFDAESQTAEKSPIFLSNPARRSLEVSYCDNIQDAVSISLDRVNAIDLSLISSLMDEEPAWVETEIERAKLAYRDTAEPERFIRAQQYLSGQVFTKLEEAQLAAQTDSRFCPNVEALEAVLPERLDSIDVRPGASWIPQEVYKQYASERLGLHPARFTITHENDTWYVNVDKGSWGYGGEQDQRFGVIAAKNAYNGPFNFQATGKASAASNQGVACNRNDGVVVTAPQMFESILNLSSRTLNYSKAWNEEHPHGGSVHSEASAFAGRKAKEMREDFAQWALDDPQRRQLLVDRYNDIFNAHVATQWDGSHRTMPGLGESFKPYNYQLNAVERMVNSPSTLLSHVVGAGKTGTMLMGAAELKRLGRIHQPWLVVPNHIASQITNEAIQWYPNAKVLSASGINTAEGRREFVAQTTADDWDFVIVPQSVFERVPMSIETQLRYMEGQKSQLEESLWRAKEAAGGDEKASSVRDIIRNVKNLETKIEDILNRERDVGLEFEQTACDYLIVDEAHLYKNLMRSSRVRDLTCAGSSRASDLHMKLEYLRDTKDDNAPVVTFATGTPIANNLAEIWVMMHYLRPDLTTGNSLGSVNEFAATFTEQVEDVEMNPSGTELRKVTRTSAFLNTGDLATVSSLFIDSVTRDQIPAALPQLGDAGENTIIEFEVEQEVKDFINDLGWRADYNWDEDPERRAMKETYGPKIDNALKISGDGRAVSLHPSLANLHVDGAGARVQAVQNQILDVWEKNRDQIYIQGGEASPVTGGLQIVFCDKGTPNKDDRFSVYQGLKDELVKSGMDAQRIQFIHDWDHDRDALFRDCRNGHVDVLIGSTEKLGTGANIQARAVALHHVDVPWRPADLEQREGRVIRQGNLNKRVEIFNYIASGTFDAVQWQTLARKAKFISQFLSADRSIRRIESIEDSGAQAAAHNKAIATGDPRYVELMELETRERELVSLHSEWKAKGSSVRFQRTVEESAVKRLTSEVSAFDHVFEGAAQWVATDPEQRAWTDLKTGQYFEDRKQAAEHVGSTVVDMFGRRTLEPTPLISIGGVDFHAWYYVPTSSVVISPLGSDGFAGREIQLKADDLFNDQTDAPRRNLRILTRVENRVKSIPEDLNKTMASLESSKLRLAKLESFVATDFEHTDELSSVVRQRESLQRALAAVSESQAAKQLQRERDARNDEHGREPGWTLRLNPSPGYADMVEDRSQREVIYHAQRDTLEAQYNAGTLTVDELSAGLQQLNSGSVIDNDSAQKESEAPVGVVSDVVAHTPNTSLLDVLGMDTSTIAPMGTVVKPLEDQVVLSEQEKDNSQFM
ncbi:helicase-related protein [Corynebacterium callunae]|uniref:Helicase n=1 Tax=Corynebacterium callunae DSM 20147 TaxID=1121353 RepID=M1UDX8_9CORY|nr:helicase-related protein [Corynebacterium callunae]AGG66205.1 hypothetical protein H924_03795 [Corynebacterium callunae DSM 20147]